MANLAERSDRSATMTDAAEARLDRMLEAATAAGLEAALITSDESVLLSAGALAERIGVPVEKIRIAVSYYGEYPDEVDRFIAANEQEAEQLERALETERRLLG